MRDAVGNYVYIRNDTGDLIHLEIWEEWGSITVSRYYNLRLSECRWVSSQFPGVIREVLKDWKCTYIGKL